MSDSDERNVNLLIIRRGGSAELDTPKGGVWKIAYADFMTAMMAFFLVMWLINATSETTKTGVANYFNPIKLSDGMQLPKKGLYDPEHTDFLENEPAPGESENPTPVPAEEKGESETETKHAEEAAATEEAEIAAEAEPSGRIARYSEEALFRDPYAVLAAIAAQAEGESSLEGSGAGAGAGAEAGSTGGEAYNDPFDPAAWKSALLEAPTEVPSPTEQPGLDAALRETGREGAEQVGEPGADAEPLDGPGGDAPAPAAAGPSEEEVSAARASQAAVATGEDTEARLRAELIETLKQVSSESQMPNVTITEERGGVLISLADQIDFGMFAIGSAEPLPETIAVMRKIAEMLKGLPGKVIIRGHTDGRPFRSEVYDNWRLSAARAHMAYHMLVHGGLDERRVERIEGYADRALKLPDNPEAAENRRIDILIQEASS